MQEHLAEEFHPPCAIDQDGQVAALDDSWFGEPSVLAVHEWLQSSEGQAMIAKTLRSRGLPTAFDADIERMVIRSAARAISRGKTIESPPAWATSCARLRALDILKSPMSKLAPRRERDEDRAADDDARFGPDVQDQSMEQFETSAAADDVRRRVLSNGTIDWCVAAALAVLAFNVDRTKPSARCPRPVGGAGELESSYWAGLWYGGRRDCFEDESAAIRQRRSRASAQVRHALAEAGRAAGLERANNA